MESSLPSVCVIGAGSSGIAAAKVLHQRGFAFDCFEASDRVGGNWVFGNRNGMSSAYRSLHINTSRERMAVPRLPDAAGLSGLPAPHAHRRLLRRLRRPLRLPRPDHVRHARGRRRARARAAGRSRSPAARRAATTPCSSPTATTGPALARSAVSRAVFAGRVLHSHEYTGEDRAGRSATGASSCSAWGTRRWTSRSTRASRPPPLYLAARRGAWVIPKYVFGRPLDQFSMPPQIPCRSGGGPPRS